MLNMTQRRALSLYGQLVEDLKSQSSYTIHVERGNIPVGKNGYSADGGTRRLDESSVLIQLDDVAAGFGKYFRAKPFVRMQDLQFVRGIFVIQHEFAHVGQFEAIDGLIDGDDLGCDVERIAMGEVAAFQNKVHYQSNHDLYLQELDANFTAVLASYDYLEKTFPDVDVESLVVGYVNDRRGKNFTFLPHASDKPAFESLDDVVSAFKLEFVMAEFSGKPYRMQRSELRSCQDEMVLAFDLGIYNSTWEDFAKKFDDACRENGCEADRMMACVACYLHPEYLEQYPVLKSVDLSPENVFGKAFPETPVAMKQRIEDWLGHKSVANGCYLESQSDVLREVLGGQVVEIASDVVAPVCQSHDRSCDGPEFRFLNENVEKQVSSSHTIDF